MKHIHTFESFINEASLNYGQAMELAGLQDIVKNHIKDNHPDLYYGSSNNILGKMGRDIPETSWKKLEKLAKDKGDKELESAIANYKELSKKYKGKAFESSDNEEEVNELLKIEMAKVEEFVDKLLSKIKNGKLATEIRKFAALQKIDPSANSTEIIDNIKWKFGQEPELRIPEIQNMLAAG
jgi:hypothetical protein